MERGKREARELPMPELIGDSAVWSDLKRSLSDVARSGLPVMILGETGTGKELVARTLHGLSARRSSAFVAHNCGATPDSLIESELFGHARGAFTGAVADRAGLFESANGGTLFLDEIGDASALLQMKLLRVLQEGEARRVGETRVQKVDVRVISATHHALERAVSRQGFRLDLYYRLNTVRLELPALRERGRDVLRLADVFLARAAESCGRPAPRIAGDLESWMLRHRWPGNVRELGNGCAYAIHVAGAVDQVRFEHWPKTPMFEPGGQASGLHAETRELEARRLREALERSRGNKTRAARALGLSRQGLLKKLRRYGLLTDEDEAAEVDAPVATP
jgi:two-component system response regulator HupR/HoxA